MLKAGEIERERLTKKVADERTVEISDLVEMVGRWDTSLATVQLRSLVSIVAKDEAKKKTRHHLLKRQEEEIKHECQ